MIPNNFQNKSVSPFKLTVHMYSLLGQTEGRRKVDFLKEDWGRRRVHGETSKSNWYLQETQTVSPFVKFEISSPLLCYLLDLITNNYINVRCSMISNILWIDTRMCRKNPLLTAGKAVLLSKMKSLFSNLSICPNVNKSSCFVSKFCILSA